MLTPFAYRAPMPAAPQPLRFGQHALAVLASTMLIATVFALLWTGGAIVASRQHPPTPAAMLGLAAMFWLGVFAVALPSAGLVLSALWPVVRRRTAGARALCVAATTTTGVLLTPLASRPMHGATVAQLLVFAGLGLGIGAAYLLFTRPTPAGEPRLGAGSPDDRLTPA